MREHKAFASLRELPRAVWLLGLVSLCNDAMSEMIYPLLPIYLASVLLSGPQALGVIEGVAEATGSLLKLFAGVVADRQRAAKPWVVAGYALAAMARPLLAFAASWPIVLLLRAADRVGKGLRAAPRDALLALSIPPHCRGLAFGVHRALDNLGAVLGPLLAAALLAAAVPWSEIFLYTAVGGAIAVTLALGVTEPERSPVRSAKPFSWQLRALPPTFRRYLLVLALFTLGNSSNMFLLLRASELGLPPYQVPLLWGLVSLVAALLSTPLSALSDRLGRVRLITGGWIAYALFYLSLAVTSHAWLLWPVFAAYGVFLAATEGAEKALVADLAPSDQLGTAFGWVNLTCGVFLLPASLVFGWLWQEFSAPLAFAWSAGLATAGAVLLPCWVMQPVRDAAP